MHRGIFSYPVATSLPPLGRGDRNYEKLKKKIKSNEIMKRIYLPDKDEVST
jgi:hypothetical protein